MDALLEPIYHFFGYWTARIVIPVVSFGFVFVQHLDDPRAIRAWSWSGRRIILGHEFACIVGVVIWMVALIVASLLSGELY